MSGFYTDLVGGGLGTDMVGCCGQDLIGLMPGHDLSMGLMPGHDLSMGHHDLSMGMGLDMFGAAHGVPFEWGKGPIPCIVPTETPGLIPAYVPYDRSMGLPPGWDLS